MKKLFSMLLCLLTVFSLAVSASADVIWEPIDSFYSAHFDDCIYVNSRYEAQTDTEVRESPESDKVVGTIEKGKTLYIGYAWPKSCEWAYVEDDLDSDVSGWVRLADFRRLYNADDFHAEHAADITEEEGTVPMEDGCRIVLWTFPGSGTIVDTLDSGDAWEDDPAFVETWTDEDGRKWGNINYYYGLRGWVCLSDLSSEELPATAPVYADGTETGGDAPAGTPAGEENKAPAVPVLVIMLVAAVVIVTAAVIVLLTRKKKAE